MPKYQAEHLIQSLQRRIKQLENAKLLEARDINVLLNKKQKQDLKNNWSKQQALRKIHKPPKTEKDKKSIGWKTIREVRLEILNEAVVEANEGLLESFEKRLKNAELKRAKSYTKKYFNNIKEGVNKMTSTSRANNELTKHGLQRIDRMQHNKFNLRKRDKEINEIEDALRKKFEAELTKDKKK
jgi:hypothetical protein